MSEYLDTLIAEMEANGTAPRIAAKTKKKKDASVPVLTVEEAPEGSPYSYEKDGKKYLAEYIGMVGAPEAKSADPNFPTGQMSYDTFPYGAMSEVPEKKRKGSNPTRILSINQAPEGAPYVYEKDGKKYLAEYIGLVGAPESQPHYTNPALQWRKDGKTYRVGYYGETPIVEESTPRTTEEPLPEDEDYLIPMRPVIDWDNLSLQEELPQGVGVSYAGGLSDVAVDPDQVRSAVSGFVPNEEPKNVAVDPMQFLSNNGLLPPNGAVNLDEITPEAEDAKIPRWAKVAMSLADAMRISGTRGGLFPETAVEDPNAKMGATFDEILKQQKQEAEYEKQAKQNDLARAKILSQRAMEETDPARKAVYGEAIKRLLPRETQGLDPVTASGMFTGDDKIALEREKQKGRELLQLMKGQQGYGLQELKGQQTAEQKSQDQANKIEQIRTRYAEMGNLENQKQEGRKELAVQKHIQNLELQDKKDEAAFARQLAKINATLAKAGAATQGNGKWSEKAFLEPEQGVIEALQLMESYPDAFSPSASVYDTKFGRTIGLMTTETAELRNQVKANLQTVVRASTANLMQLFPKGGSGVINTATEQRLFLPVAEAIASGEWNKIIPYIKAYYGGMYDAAQAYAGEKAAISRDEYVRLMMTGVTSDGLTRVPLRPTTPASQPAGEERGVGSTWTEGGATITKLA